MFNLLVCLILMSCSTAAAAVSSRIKTGNFTTLVDHFNPTDLREVVFHYSYNDEYGQNAYYHPIFIYIKEFGDVSTRWIEHGLMNDIARSTRGVLYTFDHRYCGQNPIFNSTTFENLRYLSLEQSLADIATFAKYISGFYNHVIVWGSGYGGTLAVLARIRYPHLINGVWSSSASFTPSTVNYMPYDHLETILYRYYNSQNCRNRVFRAFADVEDYLHDVDVSYVNYIQEKFNLCHPIDVSNSADKYAFFEHFYAIIIDYINEYHIAGLYDFCSFILKNTTISAMESFAHWTRTVIYPDSCFDHRYETIIKSNNETSIDLADTNRTNCREQFYIQCTQIGNFKIADNITWLPNIPANYSLQKCADIFGPLYTIEILERSQQQLTTQYGLMSQFVESALFVNGYLDAWFPAGNVNNFGALFIDDCGKSADLASQSFQDSYSQLMAKQRIYAVISVWLIHFDSRRQIAEDHLYVNRTRT